jgi:adenine phosphoribosyltransferase
MLNPTKQQEITIKMTQKIDLKTLIRDVHDFPKEGIVFKDISPLLADVEGWKQAVDEMHDFLDKYDAEILVGLDARGFLIAAPLSYVAEVPFCMARKPGKLPWETLQETYSLEYGENTLEINCDAIHTGQRVVICDDLLATGGTAKAAKKLIEQLGGNPVALVCLIELEGLDGRKVLGDMPVSSLLKF